MRMALPKIVYVYEETAANGERWLVAARRPFDAAAHDGTRRMVGTYKLVKREWVKKSVVITDA